MSAGNGKLQKELLVRLTRIIKFFTADAAGDEQVAGGGCTVLSENKLDEGCTFSSQASSNVSKDGSQPHAHAGYMPFVKWSQPMV